MKIKMPEQFTLTVTTLLSGLQALQAPIFLMAAFDGQILVSVFFGLTILGLELAKKILNQYVFVPKASLKRGMENSLAARAKRFKKNMNKHKDDK